MAYYGDKTPKLAFDAQRSRIRRSWGFTAQVGCARLITVRCTMYISMGDSESPVAAPEADQDAESTDNCHCTYPYHGQGAFASCWRAGSGQLAAVLIQKVYTNTLSLQGRVHHGRKRRADVWGCGRSRWDPRHR